jgi:hypothetical protein
MTLADTTYQTNFFPILHRTIKLLGVLIEYNPDRYFMLVVFKKEANNHRMITHRNIIITTFHQLFSGLFTIAAAK